MAGRGGYVGNSGGATREIIDMYVGTPTGKKQVAAAYVGTPQGNKLWYARTPDLVFTQAGASSTSQIGLSWLALGPSSKFTYNLYRNGGLLASTGLTAYQDSGLAPSTTYTYQVNAIRNGIVADSASIAVRTQDIPPPQFQDREFYINATGSASWSGIGAGTKRTSTGSEHVYAGQVPDDSRRGVQRSLWNFNIPGDVRNCVSINNVSVSVYVQHHNFYTGGELQMVVHHGNFNGGYNSYPNAFPGSTAPFRNGLANRLSWWGGGEWINVTNDICPGRTYVKEEFRVNTAWGFGFVAPDAGGHWYGYGRGATESPPPRLYMHYTVRL